MKKTFNYLVLFFVLVSLISLAVNAEGPIKKNYFLMGDGLIEIKNVHNNKKVSVNYLNEDGSLNDQAFLEIDSVFGFPTKQKGENISRRLIAMLDYFVDMVAKNQTVMLTSGYRSPEYNQGLRNKGRTAAKTSTHIDGMALDFYLEGRNAMHAKALWDIIRNLDCCGVGHYGGRTIHLDAGRPRFWEQATSKVHSKEPPHNRFIYFSTEYDVYSPKEKVRAFFTSISDFGFGIKNRLVLISGDDKVKKVASINLDPKQKDNCVKVNERKDARFIYAYLPKIKSGKYRVRVEYCDRPFEDMPEYSDSNIILIE